MASEGPITGLHLARCLRRDNLSPYGDTGLFTQLVAILLIRQDLIVIQDRGGAVASSPRLRFSPLEIFPERQLQPILPWPPPWSFFRKLAGLAPTFIPIILHCRPIQMLYR